jgi:hypothetical protein
VVLTITLTGIGVGLAFSAAISRLMTNVLYGVSPTDIVTSTGAAFLWRLYRSSRVTYPPAAQPRLNLWWLFATNSLY